MLEYFPGNYPWNLALNGGMNGGGIISEIDDAVRHLIPKSKDGVAAAKEWGEAWANLARKVEKLGDADLAKGHKRSASRKYRRAAAYYFVADRNMNSHDPTRDTVYKTGMAVFRKHVECAGEPVEFLEVPYQGKSLPAIFSPAKGGKGKAPCMIHFDGFDVNKEVIYLRGIVQELNLRGISVLVVDHPGVGEALRLRGMPLFPEVEVPAGAAVDYLETRKDVDPMKIGIIALSLGGYYAPRAAAFEKRLACCVAWGAIWDYGAISEARAKKIKATELSVSDWADHAMTVFGVKSVEEVLAITSKMTLATCIDKITCPILVAHGELDKQIPLIDAQRTYDGAVNSKRRELKVFSKEEGGYEHCMADNVSNGIDYMADWIADVLQP